MSDFGKRMTETGLIMESPIMENVEGKEKEKRERKTLRKKIDEPWLTWIVEGKKKCEARIKRGEWAELEAGDTLIAYNEKWGDVQLEIVHVADWDNFNSMYLGWGEEMIPDIDAAWASLKKPRPETKFGKEAQTLYNEFPNHTDADIEKHGCIALRIKAVDVKSREK